MALSSPLSDKMYGYRARIGYTSPPLTTEVFPYEFYKIVPAGVTLVVTSLAIVVRSKDEVDQSYDISMRAAREMAAAGCDIVVLGGVPINLSRGSGNAEQMITDLEAELSGKISSSTAAQARAAKALGCRRVWTAVTGVLMAGRLCRTVQLTSPSSTMARECMLARGPFLGIACIVEQYSIKCTTYADEAIIYGYESTASPAPGGRHCRTRR